MDFYVISRETKLPSSGVSCAYLRTDNWNDYSFRTLFQLYCFDEGGQLHELGDVKIGFRGQVEQTSTDSRLDRHFQYLDSSYFSLGQRIEFYKTLAVLSPAMRDGILSSLRDIVAHPEIIESIENERSLGTSLLRDVTLATIKGQFRRVLNGQVALTDFNFNFERSETEHLGAIKMAFKVTAESTPSTNIHAVIGRNGAGKTTLLNGMVDAITRPDGASAFTTRSFFGGSSPISSDYFSSLVSVSFSAFDPFTPPSNQPDPAKGTCYFYLGLKDQKDSERLRSLKELQADCVTSLIACFSRDDRTERWNRVMNELSSDENFSSMQLERLHDIYKSELLSRKSIGSVQVDSAIFHGNYLNSCRPFLDKMSSGHAVVFLIMTRLVSIVEEKTLVLLDEPESHLHPPLLSAFLRALSDLLYDRNGIAIIATHSPVVLQEIPKSCVWKMYRVGESVGVERPNIETFAENVGTLTSEVFRLEVSRSGFHKMLALSVAQGMTYNQIIASYDGQLGLEGRAVLKLLMTTSEEASS
ncbi:AAA family ATPase [Dyella humi]|uniref:AAA family ATPase n=1 Tax=Dyella humi TaxID=1770547 RepID=A0ABW8II88_9GAMM